MNSGYYKIVSSPVGELFVVASDKSLLAVMFGRSSPRKVELHGLVLNENHPLLLRAEKQLAEYFAGKRKEFSLPLEPKGTIFQLKAWKALRAIPYGETISYAAQARVVGDVKKARAVGMANGRNPLSIVVPCHRVIGSDGGLTGFGGGLSVKQFLLDHERRNAA
jgi:methylated-DNA-[protein]-cysteine S-methyltransferase